MIPPYFRHWFKVLMESSSIPHLMAHDQISVTVPYGGWLPFMTCRISNMYILTGTVRLKFFIHDICRKWSRCKHMTYIYDYCRAYRWREITWPYLANFFPIFGATVGKLIYDFRTVQFTVMIDVGQEPIPFNSNLWCLFYNYSIHYRCWYDQWLSSS